MSTVKVNGKNMPSDSALELLAKESTKVTKLSLTFKNEKKKKDIPTSSIGFTIPKAMISELCRTMDRMNADRIKYKLNGSPYILNRNLTIIMEDPRPEPRGVKKLLRRLAEWLMEKSE